MNKTRSATAFTLIELLLVMAVCALLCTLAFPLFGEFRLRAGNAVCVSHLRVLHSGFVAYLGEHDNIWPQLPQIQEMSELEESKWWSAVLKDYGVASKHWVCPSDNSYTPEEQGELQEGEVYGSYTTTTFDGLPNTAFKWQQPWVIERGNFHGASTGPNMVMPDGSVQKGVVIMQ